jgi:hypothetical protein
MKESGSPPYPGLSGQKARVMDMELLNRGLSKPKIIWYQTAAFLAITIGVPFCIFKYLFGILTVRVGMGSNSHLLICCGWLVIVWAAIDLLMNLARILLHLGGRRPGIEFCLVAQVGRILNCSSLFLAVDTLLSFSIICFVLCSGWIKHLVLYESYLWCAATTLNLISISLVNIFGELNLYSAGKTKGQRSAAGF